MSCLGMVDAMRSTELPLAHRWVWACLENHANGARFWSITVDALAKELGISRVTVLRGIADLEARQIIRVERGHRRVSVYHMLRVYDQPARDQPAVGFTADTQTPPVEFTADTQDAPAEFTDATQKPDFEFTNATPNPTVSKPTSKGSLRSPPARARAHARGAAHRLPEDWQPSDPDRVYALAHNVDADKAAEEMRNYWLARGDGRAAKVDWSRTFRNSVLMHEDRGRFRVNVPPAAAKQWPSRKDWLFDEAEREGTTINGTYAAWGDGP